MQLQDWENVDWDEDGGIIHMVEEEKYWHGKNVKDKKDGSLWKFI